ncbi:DUF6428 family protein [Galbibacter mesophilus]|uniref:DUF6428 family protein n=1 Tax=Galbibacter mesophilus TaxID=379069 RepID=UPI00191FDAB3|nr:DUF6428 family protein [Galbibacter mesophilus]MCM5663328.1 DUF6428 family protein [Galbibacter mesophilus]
MKLSEFKASLEGQEQIAFQLPNGSLVPSHFHVTEVGAITKRYIDCGGILRNEEVISLQLWEENDYNHRLHPEKLINIIALSEEKLQLGDHEIEVEYQGDTICKYHLEFTGGIYQLVSTQTDCLAKDKCGIPPKKKVKLSELNNNTCTPGSGCC